MSPSGTTGRLDALERRGFIRRVPDPGDRRKVLVELTDAGREAWLATFDPQTNEEANVLGVLELAEQEQLDGMLRRTLQAVDRPGLLNTPSSSLSGDSVPGPRSRFTPD